MRQMWIRCAINISVWMLVAVFWTTAIYFDSVTKANSWTWLGIFVATAPSWMIWAAVTPLILWLGRRFPIDPLSWRQGALVHLLCSIVWMGVYTGALVLVELIRQRAPIAAFWEFKRRAIDVQIYFDYFIYWMILAVSLMSQYYRRAQQREREAARLRLHNSQLETQLVHSQLQTLKAQLNPHFLFNTLNSISALVRQDEKKDATKVIAALSDLLRKTIEQDNTQLVPLIDEMAFIESYLAIQQIRFKHRLRVCTKIEPEAISAAVPNMLLQPLVENAIRHGVAESLEPVNVRVSAVRQNGALEIEVFDDGPCLPDTWRWERHAGIGLTNTRRRLETLYGDGFQLRLSNVGDNGVTARITIPFAETNEHEEHSAER